MKALRSMFGKLQKFSIAGAEGLREKETRQGPGHVYMRPCKH